MGDWSKAYEIIGDSRADSLRKTINAETIAETEFRVQASQSPIAKYNGKDDPKKGPEDGKSAGDIAKSIGKGLIDFLSVVPYTQNAIIEDMATGAETIGKGIGEKNNGDILKGIGQLAATPVTGVYEGLKGAVGQDDDVKTWKDTVKKVQEVALPDTDPDSKVSKRVQAGVGLAGDIFLDPTTYLTVGAAPVIKGAIQGAKMGGKKAAKVVDDAAERGRAAGMSEEQVQRQIIEHPNAELYDGKLTGAAQGAKKEYAAWKKSEAIRKIAKAERRAAKKSGNQADEITPELTGPNVRNELMPRPQSSFVAGANGIEPQGAVQATNTTEAAMRATKEFEDGRRLRAAAGGTASAVGKAEDEVADIVDTRVDDYANKLKEEWRSTPSPKTETPKESVTAKLVESVQGAPVTVGNATKEATKVEKANAQLVETLGSSRAQEILDVLGAIKPKGQRYNAATMRKIRKEYAARPSVLKQKNSLGLRSEQTGYIAPTAKAAEPIVAKEKSTAFTSGSNVISPIELHKTLMKLKSNTQIALKGRPVIYAPQLAKELRVAIEAKDRAKVQELIDLFHTSWFNNKGQAAVKGKVATPAAKTVDEEVDEIIPDNPNEELFEEIDVPNPNAVTEQELVENFGIKPEDAGRLLDEIENMVDDLDISGRITNKTITDVSKYIQSKHISKSEMELLKKLTGKDTKAEVATEIRAIMNAHKTEMNGLKAPAKATKVQKSEEEIAKQAEGIETLATAMAKSPTALDAAVGQQRLASEYDRAVQDIAKAFPDVADDLVAGADNAIAEFIEYQNKVGARKTGRGFDVNQAASTAWMRGSFNSHSAITMHGSVIKHLNTKMHAGKLGSTTSGLKAKQYMAIMKVADAKMRAMGIQPFQSYAHHIGSADKAVNLSLYDILRELGDDTVKDLFFFKGKNHGFDVTQVMGAVEAFMRGKAAGMDPNDLGREIAEWFTKPQSKIGLGKKQRDNLEKALATKHSDRLAYGEGFARKLLNPKSSIHNNLSYRMLINSAQHASAVGKHIENLTEPAIARLAGMPTGRSFMAAMDDEIADLKKQFTPEEWELAEQALESQVRAALQLSKNDRQSLDFANKISKATKSTAKAEKEALEKADEILPNGKPAHTGFGNAKPATKVPTTAPKVVHDTHVAQSRMAEEEIRAIAPEGVDEFAVIGATIATDMVRKLHPVKSFFVPSLGIKGEGVYRAMNTGLHTVAHLQNNFHEQLLKHLSTYGNAQLTRDFKQIQETVANNTGRLSNTSWPSNSARDLYNVIDTMFAVSGKNVFEANGVGAIHFNNLANSAGLNAAWRFNPEFKPNENAKLWTKWEGIENVPDFLSKMHNVAVRASQDISIAASFTKQFGVIGKREGYVKISRRENKNDVGLYELINRDMYYPIEIARDFAHADNLLRESRSVSGKGPMGKFVINVMDPVTNALKASQTTVRPGHWVLSVVGDTLRNHLAGVNSITPYKQAVRILKAGGHSMDELGPIEKYRMKATSLNHAMVEGSGKGIKVNIGGKIVNISDESMYRLMQNVVHLPPHSGGVMEDVLDNGTDLMKFGDTIKKATEFVTNNQAFNGKASLNRLASIRDNWMRTTLALDHIQKGRYKNVQEMKDAMEDFVTKWAPTSTDFTAKESKYARRAFLYYTWLRGITPRVAETMLNRPGISTVMSKAQYALASANGIDPMSIGNPFPEDGLYPDYYYNSVLGPQWKDDEGGEWGINPSHPTLEVLNNFAGVNPMHPVQSGKAIGQTLIGMSTPFAKIPLELAQGQSGKIPIENNGQYLLDNLGGSWASSLSRATGKTLGADGIVDRTDTAAKRTPEEQREHAKLQGINFMTGAQLKDYQSEGSVKSALYSQQERMRREKERAMRSGDY